MIYFVEEEHESPKNELASDWKRRADGPGGAKRSDGQQKNPPPK